MDRDPEALRRRLYRPGASAADLAVYLRATEEERAEETADPDAPPAPGPPLRPFVVGGAVVGAAALLGAVLLTSAPRTVAPTAAPTVAAATGSPGPPREAFSDVQILDGGPAVHAAGSATQEGSQMYRYVIARGDTVPAIADRFGICQADVTDALPYGADPAELLEGQGLELSRSESNEC